MTPGLLWFMVRHPVRAYYLIRLARAWDRLRKENRR